MNSDKHLHFILNKISDLNIARFHCESTSVLRIPNSVVSTYSVDNSGYLFFFLPRPQQLLSEFEREFMVGVHYFRKGVNHYINIEGFARMISDPEELHNYDLLPEEINQALTKDVLVKVKILKADYFEKMPARKSMLTKIRAYMYHLLVSVSPAEKSFDFRKDRQIHNFGFKNLSMRNLFPRIQFFQ